MGLLFSNPLTTLVTIHTSTWNCFQFGPVKSPLILGVIQSYHWNMRHTMKSIMRFTRAQNSCLPSIILMILLNSVSRGTRLAEDFLNASRSHRLPRWRISPPGTRVLSSRIVFTSISCSICLRSDLRYGDLFVRNPWDRAHGNKTQDVDQAILYTLRVIYFTYLIFVGYPWEIKCIYSMFSDGHQVAFHAWRAVWFSHGEILPLRQLARRVEQEKAKQCIEPSWHVFNTHGRKSTGGLLMIFGVLRCMSSTTIHHHLNTGPPHPLSPSGAGGGWANWIGTPVASKEVTLRISWKEVTYASLIFVSGLFAFWV